MTDNQQNSYDVDACPFSWDKLDGLLALKSNCVVCSELLGVSKTTIKDHIKKRYSLTFTEYAELKLSPTKVRLVQKALKMAEKGDRVMLIFCLKNLCQWADKLADVTEDDKTINVTFTRNDTNSSN